jgi:phosphoesterase RecJ-like protein
MFDIASLRELLAQPQKIVITTHHKPDGDAMGSSLGLYNYLIQQGHHATVISPTDYPEFLSWMPGNGTVMIYTEKQAAAAELIANAALIFCLDFNALGRINDMGELVRKSPAKKVMIDHHLEPEDFDDYRYWNINACATAQLIYQFIVEELNGKQYVNADVATCLYTGIMTDSGSFRFPGTTSACAPYRCQLIDAGAVNWRIHELVYSNSSKNACAF